MKRENILKHVTVAFFLAVVTYFLCFSLLEYRRTYKGPWTVTFLTDPAGRPAILISQPRLKISSVKITFTDKAGPSHNAVRTIRFDGPGKKLPFGEVSFVDTTFLPGTVVMNTFGHEIQLLSSGLTIDQQERPWESGMAIPLSGVGKLRPVVTNR